MHYQLPNAGYAGKGSVALAKVAFSPLQRQFCRGWTAECLLLPAPPAAGGRSPSLSQGDRSEGLSVVPTSTPHPNKDTQTWENETSVLISNPLTFKKRVNFFFYLAIYQKDKDKEKVDNIRSYQHYISQLFFSLGDKRGLN